VGGAEGAVVGGGAAAGGWAPACGDGLTGAGVGVGGA
jgi:hypothetical protein